MEYGAILFGGVKWAGERALIANAQNYLLGEEFRMQKTKYNSNCVTQCVCVCVCVCVCYCEYNYTSMEKKCKRIHSR